MINDNLNWDVHHDAILSKAYRTLGLIQRTFYRMISIPAKAKLCIYHLLDHKYYTALPCGDPT